MSINLSHLKKLIATMIPILIAQVSTVGMNFMDSTMSGHVSANDLAGVSIGASLFLPIQTTAMGLLTAATPMAAQLMGKKEKEGIPMIIRTGLYLALLLSFLFALLYYLLIDTVLEGLSLAPAVSSIAKDYMLALVGAFLFEMLAMPLRSLTDTVGATTISMRLFLLALPVNGLLNYAFIFGKWGAPALGGVGAGIATLLTYVFLVLLFLAVILSQKPFMGRALFPHRKAASSSGKSTWHSASRMRSVSSWKRASSASSSSSSRNSAQKPSRRIRRRSTSPVSST